MSIKMPDSEEKKRSIQMILEKGIPSGKSLPMLIPDLIGRIGMGNLFWGTQDCIFLALIGTAALAILFLLPAASYMEISLLGLFFVSPAFYGLLHLLTIWKEQQSGLYEIKMTCQYTLRELTALRMVFFGGASVLIDVLFVLLLCRKPQVILSLLQMMGISLSALFLYGMATLMLLSVGRKKESQLLVPIVWCFLCVLPVILKIDIWEYLSMVPNMVVCLCVVFTAFFYFFQLGRYLSINNQGGIYNAVS